MLENALRTLFDFQRFENNQQLRSVIEAVEEKYPDGLILSLTDAELELAAGGVRNAEEGKKDTEHDGHSLL